ncbi:hypothetical protein [Mycobacterium sp. NAZ190054]|uniref:hypothetical protein n=1 Tax=Mycobacterium sp. NAZ190054 TaxID=1747766 RepID=UPI000793D4E4|nr:hypothetical protein [Mycobacterium sp. NAZ190054]KWX66829.1 hypothetical protein ASJ79_05545 [Mycobacterium sp. NAZ190054]
MSQLALPSCALPGCHTPVGAWGDVCDGCVAACGPLLRHNPGGHRITQAEIDARDRETAAAYAMQGRVS